MFIAPKLIHVSVARQVSNLWRWHPASEGVARERVLRMINGWCRRKCRLALSWSSARSGDQRDFAYQRFLHDLSLLCCSCVLEAAQQLMWSATPRVTIKKICRSCRAPHRPSGRMSGRRRIMVWCS